ncbi:MAG TPA: YciK family oxidoreductase [Steroidobacteraceae bacterium]|jgi:NAD(P)-dependent dehydrogenase (short-subunit alcohol dehydrogenase family)|nr:YciK family oxidoreductase [Steroidobacteraceae bacterium]
MNATTDTSSSPSATAATADVPTAAAGSADAALPAHLRFRAGPEELRGRVVAITGAGDGIGRALALAAAAHGAEVVLIGRTVRKLEQVHAQITALKGAEASIAPLDLEKAVARDYDQLAMALQQRYGRLDGLVHNAGLLGVLAPIEHYDVPTWCRVLHVNLTAAFALTQVLLPVIRASADASIVFTSSGVARHPKAYWGAYAVSKAGIEALSGLLSEELQAAGSTRVNTLNPGPVRTRMRRQAFPAEDQQRLAAPEDIVQPYLWLLGAASRGVTGQCLDCQAAR